MLEAITNVWTDTKSLLWDDVGVSRDFLHFAVGGFLFVVVRQILRTSPSAVPLAVVCVLGLQLLNETLDALQWYSWTNTVNWKDVLKDTALTLMLPLVALIWWLR